MYLPQVDGVSREVQDDTYGDRSSEQKRTGMERNTAVWGNGDLDELDDVMAADVTAMLPGGESVANLEE